MKNLTSCACAIVLGLFEHVPATSSYNGSLLSGQLNCPASWDSTLLTGWRHWLVQIPRLKENTWRFKTVAALFVSMPTYYYMWKCVIQTNILKMHPTVVPTWKNTFWMFSPATLKNSKYWKKITHEVKNFVIWSSLHQQILSSCWYFYNVSLMFIKFWIIIIPISGQKFCLIQN